MPKPNPRVVVIAGPNGAGKSTVARDLLQGVLRVGEFVNADVIAQGLSAFQPEKAAMQAGRIMLRRLDELVAESADFAFETTLASRHFAPWIRRLGERGYRFHLVFLWLPSPEYALRRVANRVLLGGHFVDDETIRRRYRSGLNNFFELYQPLATRWRFYNSSVVPAPRLIAAGSRLRVRTLGDEDTWHRLAEEYGHGRDDQGGGAS